MRCPIALYRYFIVWGSGEWYVFAARRRGHEVILLVRADLGYPEIGYVALSELRDIHERVGVELDRYYSPQRLSQIKGAA